MKFSKIAAMLWAAGAMCFACDATSGSSYFNFRTTPWFVTPGTPFTIDADSTICHVLFVGQHGGTEYGGVTVNGNVIEVRYGYLQDLACNSEPYTVSQNVPGLPAGNYELRAITQVLASGGAEFLEETFELQVSSRMPGEPHPIPALGWAGAGLCSLLVGAGAVGLLRRRAPV